MALRRAGLLADLSMHQRLRDLRYSAVLGGTGVRGSAASPYGHMAGWDLRALIVKSGDKRAPPRVHTRARPLAQTHKPTHARTGDELRQEQVCIQLISEVRCHSRDGTPCRGAWHCPRALHLGCASALTFCVSERARAARPGSGRAYVCIRVPASTVGELLPYPPNLSTLEYPREFESSP